MSDRDLGSFLPARRDGISEAEIDGELVLLDTSNGTLHLLNRAAASVWSELDGTRSVEEILADLSDASGSKVERVREDVFRFLDELARAGLLSCTLPSSGTR